MSKERLEESLEEHKANLEAIDYLTEASVRNLYISLVNEVSEALERESDGNK